MKTTAKLILIALTISFVSCSKSNDNNPSSTSKTDQVAGSWTVTYFLDSGKDETSDFSGYSFEFNSADVLKAINSLNSYTGTWTIGDNSSDDDSSSNKLVIMISGNKAMDDLQHDWLIVKITDNEIWLRDDNVSSNEEIHFGR